MKPLKQLFRTLGTTFRRCVRRFPVTLMFVLALTAWLCYLVATEGKGASDKLLMTLGYYLSVGTLLSLSLHLWGEEVNRPRLRHGVHIGAQVLLATDSLFLYYQAMGPWLVDIVIAHGAAVLAIGLSLFFLPFFRERDDIPAWNFAQTLVGILALVIIVGAVMSGGLCLLTFSLHQLFGMDVSHKCYMYLLIVCNELLPLLMFLGLLPEGEHKHDRVPQPTAFLRGTIRYLFLPLAGLYLGVLYVYAATILVRWQLPDGWVSWLVTALMAGCIAIEMGLYPSRIKDGKAIDERIARWLPLLALPLLVLMTVGIGRRFLDYGITLNRLYLATLNAWFYFVCIGLIAGRARRLSWIPISFSVVFLVTSVLPVNYASITRHTLHREVRRALVQGGQDSLPLSTEAYGAWLLTQSREEARLVSSKLAYLDDWFGTESTSDLVAAGTPFHAYTSEETDTIVVEEEGFSYDADDYTLPVPRGYRYCTRLSGKGQGDSLSYRIPLQDAAIAPDTLYIPTDTLRHRDQHPDATPPVLRTQGGNVFVLTHFQTVSQITETADGTPDLQPRLEVEGLLFHNNPPTNY